MNALFATAILTLLAPQKGTVQVKVNAKPAEVITGERTFRVTVTAKNPVTGVEFYVGSDLRDKDTSTPYEFTIDSLAENDGNLKLRFKAFTTEGESGESTVTVVIDNGTSKGLDYHIKHGTEALQDSKFSDAVTSGRIALRIDPKSSTAKLIVARGYLGQGTLDKAQKFAEDAVDANPDDQAAIDLLSAIKLRQAFTTMSAGANRAETLTTITEAMRSAAEARRKYVDRTFDAAGSPTDANLIPWTDSALADTRYATALPVLEAAYRKDDRRTEVGNRLAFTQIRLARYSDALQTLEQVKKKAAPDAYTYAQLAVVYAELGDADASDAALKDAIVSDAEDPAVLSAQAYLALKYVRHKLVDKTTLLLNYDDTAGNDTQARNNSRDLLRNALAQMEKGHGESSVTGYYRSALNNKLENYAQGETYFERAVLADALNADAFVEQGNRSLGIALRGQPSKEDLEQRLGAARAYYTAAVTAQPTSGAALAGLSLASSMGGKYEEAIRWGEAAVRAQPSYAAGYVTLGTAYNLASVAARLEADKTRKANSNAATTNAERQANEVNARSLEAKASAYARSARDTAAQGARLDKRLEGYELTKPAAAWRYLYAGGRLPVLPLPRS